MEWALQPIAPIVFGLLVGVCAFLIRHYALKRPRTVNYFSVFMSASSAFVFLVLIVNHKMNDVTYAKMLDDGFGVDEATFAFLFACYHMGREIYLKVVREG